MIDHSNFGKDCLHYRQLSARIRPKMPRQFVPEPVPEPWTPELPPKPKGMWEKFARKFKEEPLVPIGE